jgi:hypothetical protein
LRVARGRTLQEVMMDDFVHNDTAAFVAEPAVA